MKTLLIRAINRTSINLVHWFIRNHRSRLDDSTLASLTGLVEALERKLQ